MSLIKSSNISTGFLGFIFFVLICPTAVFSDNRLISRVCRQTLNSSRCEEVLSENPLCLVATNLVGLAEAVLAGTKRTTKPYMNVIEDMIHKTPSSCITGQLKKCNYWYNSVYWKVELMHEAVLYRRAQAMSMVRFTSNWIMDVINTCDLEIKEETQPAGILSCLYRGRRRKIIQTMTELNGVILTDHEILDIIASDYFLYLS